MSWPLNPEDWRALDLQREVWRNEYEAESEALAKGRGKTLSGEKPDIGTLDDFLNEHEYRWLFNQWETQWFKDHPAAEGYDIHDFPYYVERETIVVRVQG